MTKPTTRTLLLGMLLLAACAVSKENRGGEKPGKPPEKAEWKPPEPQKDAFDWVKLTSEEWLKGEIKGMRDETLEFESDELDTLEIEWKKVAELRTPRTFTVALDDRSTATGTLLMRGDQIIVGSEDASRVFNRRDLVTLVPGDEERAFWTGKLSVGLTTQTGNTEQTDFSSYVFVQRRSPESLIELMYRGYYTEIEGTSTVDNQRLTGRWNLSIGHRWFVTPFAIELYRDFFQNIELRATPSAGLGYKLLSKRLDQKRIDWRVELGGAYRTTKFVSGQENRDSTGAIVLSSTFDFDVTKKTDFRLDYSAQIGVPETSDTNQNLSATISIDVWKDLDLDFTIVWSRVGRPRPNADGTVPKKDDFKFSVLIGWEF